MYYYDDGKQCILLEPQKGKPIITDPEKLKYQQYKEFEERFEQIHAYFQERENSRIPVDKNISKSIVCDGAYLTCPYGKQYILDSSGKPTNREIFNGPKDPMIELKIPEEHHVFLMRKDPIATERDIESINFKPFKGLMCTGGGKFEKCKIKEVKKYWEKVSKTKVNGYELLLQESELICTNCPGARLTFVDNGQDTNIKNVGFDKFFSPTTRKVTKVALVTGGLVLAVMSIGDELAGIKEAGGFIEVVATQGIRKGLSNFGSSRWGGFQSARAFISEITGFDMLKAPSKALIGEEKAETFVDMIDIGETFHTVIKLPDAISEVADNLGTKNKLQKEFNQNNKTIESIKNNPLSYESTYSRKKIIRTENLKISPRNQLGKIEKMNKTLETGIITTSNKVNRGIVEISYDVTSTYADSASYLNEIEERYYEDIKEYSKNPFVSLKQDYLQDGK